MQKFLKNGKESDYMASEETVKARKELLKQMNQYIIDLGDEEIWMDWITLCVPDEATEDDYDFMAEDSSTWNYTCKIFGDLINREVEEEE